MAQTSQRIIDMLIFVIFAFLILMLQLAIFSGINKNAENDSQIELFKQAAKNYQAESQMSLSNCRAESQLQNKIDETLINFTKENCNLTINNIRMRHQMDLMMNDLTCTSKIENAKQESDEEFAEMFEIYKKFHFTTLTRCLEAAEVMKDEENFYQRYRTLRLYKDQLIEDQREFEGKMKAAIA